MAVGALGTAWVFLWLFSVRREDLSLGHITPAPSLLVILVPLMGLLGVEVAVRVLWRDTAQLPGEFKRIVSDLGIELTAVPLLVKIAVSLCGIAAVVVWLRGATRDDTALPRRVFFRRFGVLMVMVLSINIAWHFFRAWLPLFLQKQHGYSETATSWFILIYYVATDAGALTAGFATLTLARERLSVHWSRVVVFFCCALLTTLSALVAVLPAGWPLLGLLLVIGFGALGLFPVHYSFSQELTFRHQGKVTGALGCINWLGMSLLHDLAGYSIQRAGYSQGMTVAGLVPLAGVLALVCFWGKAPGPQREPGEYPQPPDETRAPMNEHVQQAADKV
jgi:ACS family hexuronate transporter-like MFS transporter